MIQGSDLPEMLELRGTIRDMAQAGDRPGIITKLKEEQAALLENIGIGGAHGVLLAQLVGSIDLNQVAIHLGRSQFVAHAISTDERQQSNWTDRMNEWREPSAGRSR